ncbi:cathelicidin antimicrobial peptide [Pelobates cultripes]|uniref:Cathelicidin antimicrobial peptide n=1 Tax=Pelobates cultripes TaxID=61616 RepID=A0AAD1RV04_PELCU|nr:cathelicidin antimicrobial peptide [Pelobates cultripes]
MEPQIHLFVILSLGISMMKSASISNVLLDMKYSTVSKAIDIFNQETNSNFVFKLFKDDHGYKLTSPDGQRQASFTIKETLCQKSDRRLMDECEFKSNGLIKTCTASTNGPESVFSVVCNDVIITSNRNGNDNQVTENKLEHAPGEDMDDHEEAGVGFTQQDPTVSIKEKNNGGVPEEDSDVSKREIKGLFLPDVDVVILEDGSEFILQNNENHPDDNFFSESENQPMLTTFACKSISETGVAWRHQQAAFVTKAVSVYNVRTNSAMIFKLFKSNHASSLDCDTVQRAVEQYNKEQSTPFLFRSLPRGSQDEQTDSQSSNVLTFKIKETVCTKSTLQDLTKCAFKEQGVVKNCTAIIDRSEEGDIVVKCDTFTEASMLSYHNLEDENGTQKIGKKRDRREKLRSFELFHKKRAINESSLGAYSQASCLTCIFDILGTKPKA